MRNRPVGRYVGHPYLNRPSTSRDRNANERVRVQGQGNVCVIFSPKSDSSKQNSNRTEEAQPEGNNSSQQEGNREPPRVNQDMLRPVLGRNNPFIPRHQFFRRNQNIVRPILIQGNRELSRLINPLYLTLQNKFEKKKLALRRLSLRGFRRITNRALDYIKHLNLELLDLTYTSVTEDAIEAFLISNPNCRIVHPAYCVCTPINPLE
ncbi:hypothetical protein NQ318_021575 [Aromia moschata]|uniref:Uncharacterized protein n=1 Tax=Aromia moschata TaxID=1265417 RepID=A0AAV8YJQ0_9CUCU|nr:hypothetical protein NQ318_021575 [Aromia moschata]